MVTASVSSSPSLVKMLLSVSIQAGMSRRGLMILPSESTTVALANVGAARSPQRVGDLHESATRAIGFIQPGQEVRILYEAFPYQQFGTYSGKVLKISQTILTKSDTFTPIELKEPAYRITVALDRPDIDAYGKKIPLQADMLLRADIILEKRSLISWLLDPLLSVRM